MPTKPIVSIALCIALAGCSAARVVVDSAERIADGDVVDGFISLAGAPIAIADDLEHSPLLQLSDSDEDAPVYGSDNPIPDDPEELAALYDPNRTLTAAPETEPTASDPYAFPTTDPSYQPGAVDDDPYALNTTVPPTPASLTSDGSLDPATQQRCAEIAGDPRRSDGTLPVPDRYFLNSICQPS